MRVDWRPEYASGNDDIDRMHRTIVERLGVVGGAVMDGRGVGAAFRDLRTSVVEHFEHEERLLGLMSETASASHRREHAHIVRLLTDGQGLCEDPGRVAALPVFVDVVGRWLIHEIAANDRSLFTFLQVRRQAAAHAHPWPLRTEEAQDRSPLRESGPA